MLGHPRLHTCYYLKKHRDDDPEPIEVHVWYDEYYKSSTAHVIYEGERALPASLARELDGAIFDGMTHRVNPSRLQNVSALL